MPDRCDADQEGLTLPPATLTRAIAREEAWRCIAQHRTDCPFLADKSADRLRALELRFNLLVGIIIGSGILGGAIGGTIATIITK